MARYTFLFLALACTVANAATLVARTVGPHSRSKTLKNGFYLCPRLFGGEKGFTVTCDPSKRARGVAFFVNGNQYSGEGVAPYSIAGDIGTVYKPWKAPYGKISIKCVAHLWNDTYERVTVTGRIGCMHAKKKDTHKKPHSDTKKSHTKAAPKKTHMKKDYPKAEGHAKADAHAKSDGHGHSKASTHA